MSEQALERRRLQREAAKAFAAVERREPVTVRLLRRRLAAPDGEKR